MNIAEIKAYQEKINAQLQEAKAVLNGLEAHTKGKHAQSEIDTPQPRTGSTDRRKIRS